MKKHSQWWIVFYSLSLFLACQATPDSANVIATVGKDRITFEEIDAGFFRRLAMQEDTLFENQMSQEFLDSLVALKLVLHAAYSSKLDKDKEIGILVDEQRPRFIIDELYKMEILEKSQPSEAELKDFYRKNGEQRKLRHILVKTKKEADNIYKDMKKGADFEQLAKEKSIDTGTKEYGGDLGMTSWGSMAAPFQESAWKLDSGEVSRPVESPFGWHVIRVDGINKLETKPYEEMAEIIKQRVQFAKQNQLTQDFLDRMKQKAKVHMDSTVWLLLLERDSLQSTKELLPTKKGKGSFLAPELFSESERKKPLLTYQGGEVTVSDFLDQFQKLPPMAKGYLADPKKVEQMALQLVMGDLLEKEAKKKGAERRPNYKSNILKLQESLMIDKMRNDFILGGLKVSDVELHAFYDSNLTLFKVPEHVKIQEVLLSTKEQAQKILNRVKAGASLSKLADSLTIRGGMKGRGGVLDSITEARNSVLFLAVKNAKKGQVVGPVPVSNSFSVIKLLEHSPARQRTYEEVLPDLRVLAYVDKQKKTFREWVASREKADAVDIHWELYRKMMDEKVLALREQFREENENKVSGTFPFKVKVGPGGKIEKVGN